MCGEGEVTKKRDRLPNAMNPRQKRQSDMEKNEKKKKKNNQKYSQRINRLQLPLLAMAVFW